MKAEYNTLTVDIKKPACKSWTNQYHFVHVYKLCNNNFLLYQNYFQYEAHTFQGFEK